jgi:methionyl-tRNA formyltransferase
VASEKKVSLFLMQQRGVNSLQALLEHFDSSIIDFVVSAKDPNVQGDYYDQIKSLCEKHSIAFFDKAEQPKPVTSGLSIAIGWRWIIDGVDRLVVIHDSLLPKYRGFAPVVSSLIDGSTILGATAFYATENYDEGEVLERESVSITYPLTIAAAIDLLAPVFAKITCRLVQRFGENKLGEGEVQDHAQATYSVWRDEADFAINWHNSSAYIRRFVDAVGPPYQGASCILNGKPAKIFDCEEYQDLPIIDRPAQIGKVIFMREQLPVVVCGEGLLLLRSLCDLSGKSMLPLKKFRSRFR